jgi:alkylation response protein AidB-like acyl-CoA dehydrogenase
MFEWSEEQLMIRDAVRRFVEAEVQPHVEELEHGDLPPYDILRKLFTTFGNGRDGARAVQGADRAGERRARSAAASGGRATRTRSRSG